jgi:hypothetical protein
MRPLSMCMGSFQWCYRHRRPECEQRDRHEAARAVTVGGPAEQLDPDQALTLAQLCAFIYKTAGRVGEYSWACGRPPSPPRLRRTGCSSAAAMVAEPYSVA